MKYNYDKIIYLINEGSKYIYREKYSSWIKFVVRSVFDNNCEVDVIVNSMKLLFDGVISSEVLDYIYSTRLSLKSIHNIIYNILIFYVNGPKFIRDIFSIYITKDISDLVDDIESNNKKYVKK